VKRREAFHCRRNAAIENNKGKKIKKKKPTGTKLETFWKQNEGH